MNPGKLKAEVDSWVAAGIITAAQADAIMTRYDTRVPAYKKMSFWLQCLAAVLVGLALFLVISANWQRMNWLTQSLITALPLIAAQAWAFWQESRGNALAAEVGWFFGSIALGANIMMQAQIFHISAYYPNGVLFWVVGILPVIWLRASSVNYLLASALFVVYLVMQINHHQFSFLSFLPLVVLAIFTWSRQRVYSVVPLFTVIYFLLQTVLLRWQIDAGGLMWDFSLILFAVALLQQLAELKETSLRRILILLFAFTALFNLLLTFKFYARNVHLYSPSVLSLVVVAISFIALFLKRHVLRERHISYVILGNILLSVGALSIQRYLEAPETDQARYLFIRIAANLIYLGSVTALLFHAISARAKGVFMGSVVAFLLWALIRYFDLFADYLVTALIFVLSAVALVFMNKLWEKKYENG